MPWEHHRLVHSGLGSSTSWSSRLASVVEHMLTAYRNFLSFSFFIHDQTRTIFDSEYFDFHSMQSQIVFQNNSTLFGNVGCPIFLQLCLGKKETFLYLAQNYVHRDRKSISV